MNVNEAKKKISEALNEAKATLNGALIGLDIVLTDALEEEGNVIEDGTNELIMLFGSLSLSAEGLTEDDIYHISISAPVSDGEIDEALLDEKIVEFKENIAFALENLEKGLSGADAVRALSEKFDEKIREVYTLEAESNERMMKTEIKVAAIAAAALGILAIVITLITRFL